jgi:GntR family transcriptional regulator
VSRSVIRQALDRLERDGLIERIKGRGTFVRARNDRAWRLQSSHGFFEDEVTRLGHSVTSRILRAERAPLPDWATTALELEPGAQGVTLERLRYVDGDLALYNINHLPATCAETVLGLSPDDSLYERLAERDGLRVNAGRRVVHAVLAERGLPELLEVPRGAPLAYIESVSVDDDDRPFDCYQTWLRTDRLPIEIAIERSPSAH